MKILVIRFSSIGDIVLTSPVLRCLKQQVGAEVHFLTKKNFACIVQSNPYVDKVFGLDRSLYRVIALLRRQDYDYILDLHHNLRSWWVKLALQRPSRSFYKANLEKWLLVNLKVDVMPDRHVVYRYLETAQEFGVRYDGQGLDYFIPSGQEVDIERWEGPSPPFIAFAIGANHATKRLPTDKIAEICRLLELPVILLGDQNDALRGEEVVRQVGSRVFNACGRLTLHQSASIIRQAVIVLAHDTGLMHIAAAFRKPILSFWGNTVPRFGMYPFYPDGTNPHTIFEVKELPCRPCSKLGYRQCPKGHFRCMNDLNPHLIAATANEQCRAFQA
ncbi:MAG: glycosyltransferase family 9 protein [Saprospiraceae bacterium]|nr:glycosyltransferase family 9 protein [Saprospiraceae bacterium]MDW8484292.1 glycosyltransferase family 9 protein [Saprospiraceae bacterium]